MVSGKVGGWVWVDYENFVDGNCGEGLAKGRCCNSKGHYTPRA